jgi:plasmid stabilization system protein ParE
MKTRSFVILAAGGGLALALAATLALAREAPARPAAVGATPTMIAQRLLGRWAGPKFGAEADQFREDRWELVFERASGPALIGRKRHRENGGWSAYERVDAVVDSSRHIWAVDEDGHINGVLRGNGRLDLVYQEPGTSDAAAAVVHLTMSP